MASVADTWDEFLEDFNRPSVLLASNTLLGDPHAILQHLTGLKERMGWTIFATLANEGTVAGFVGGVAFSCMLTFAPSLQLFS